MPSTSSSPLPEQDLHVIKKCIGKIAKGRTVVAACLYGSKVAGYARPDSDIDLLVVLEDYPYAVKYVYLGERGMKISALVVDRKALEHDARGAFLGEFVVGRLLHVYEPIVNGEFLATVEKVYKRRVILEEIEDIVSSTNVLSTEVMFTLEYIAFSKIKRRMFLYPSAAYSYYKTYSGSATTTAAAAYADDNNNDGSTGGSSRRNLEFALRGYRMALGDIMAEDPELLTAKDSLLHISDRRIILVGKGRIRLKLTKRLQEFSSYLVHTYAGRRIVHLAVKEAESKIRRQAGQAAGGQLPDFMSRPRDVYWKLPEGVLIADSSMDDWLDKLAGSIGIGNNNNNNKSYYVASKRKLGDIHSRTILYVLRHGSGEYKVVVKHLAKSKAVKWAALSLWTAPFNKRWFKVDPLFRLGSEYKAIRHIRSLGLNSPAIEAVVLDKKLLVTRFIEGQTLADVIRSYTTSGRTDAPLLRRTGEQIAKIHLAGCSLGNIKPKNIIVATAANTGSSSNSNSNSNNSNNDNNNDLYFTDVEQFVFNSGDQVWDLAQFISWSLKNICNTGVASIIAKEFLNGYVAVAGNGNISRLASSRRYVESFYPVLVPSIMQVIKKEIKHFAD